MKRLSRTISRYLANDDPLTAATNLVAFLILLDQPFYPLTLWWVTGVDVRASLWTVATAPLFWVVPLVGRWSPVAGRVMMVAAGTANTLLAARLLGEASGVELFFGPCLLLAAMAFRRSERLVSISLIGFILVAGVGLHGHYGEPLMPGSAEVADALAHTNAFSCALLTATLGLLMSGAHFEDGRRAGRSGDRGRG